MEHRVRFSKEYDNLGEVTPWKIDFPPEVDFYDSLALKPNMEYDAYYYAEPYAKRNQKIFGLPKE